MPGRLVVLESESPLQLAVATTGDVVRWLAEEPSAGPWVLASVSDDALAAEVLRRARETTPSRPVASAAPGPLDRICRALGLPVDASVSLVAARVEELAALAESQAVSLGELGELCARRLARLRELEVAARALAARASDARRQS